MTFGEITRARRIELGMSFRKFAKSVGISPTFVVQYETDRAAPPAADKIKRIAEVLGLDEPELLATAGRWEDAIADKAKECSSYKRVCQMAFTMTETELDLLAQSFEEKDGTQPLKLS